MYAISHPILTIQARCQQWSLIELLKVHDVISSLMFDNEGNPLLPHTCEAGKAIASIRSTLQDTIAGKL